jgi:hypothetical protein
VLDQKEKVRVEPDTVVPTDPASDTARSRRGNLILAVASALVFVALLEGGARSFYWLSWGRLYPVGARVYAIPLGWRLAPGEYSKLRVNGQGFRRTSETTMTPAAGSTRVFIVGGSTAFGNNGLYLQVPAAPLGEDTPRSTAISRLCSTSDIREDASKSSTPACRSTGCFRSSASSARSSSATGRSS